MAINTTNPTSKLNARFPVVKARGSATFDAGSLVDAAGTSTDVTATGAELGDFALVSLGVDTVDMVVTATVTAANTVTVRIQNESGSTVDLASTTVRVLVLDANSGT